MLIASKYGYRIAGTHTFGDKGFLTVLDAYEEASQEKSILGRRFALDHGMMVSPEVIEQSAKLGVIWSLQPPMFYGRTPSLVSRMYGEEIAHRWVLPVKSLIDAGVRVTFGADTHSDPERHPMFSLEVMVTRKTNDGRVWGPREKIDRSSALPMMTRWAAEYVLREKELGSLAAIIHKFGVSVDFLRKFRAESVFRCDYKASKLVEPNRDEARAPSGNSSGRRGLYICVGAGSQGTVRWDTDGASVMRRAFVRDKTMPGAPRCDEKFPEPGHRF